MMVSTDLLKKHSEKIIILSIIVLILIIYWPVQNYGFLNYDDQLYVTDNIKTQSGLNLYNLKSIFTEPPSEGNWHPVTMLSHALDWWLYRDNAGGHHWTSVIIHILNTVLLFFLFKSMTGAIWQSALVAALFAVHPINVESVAWIAERKNVLSTFFWILTMLFYVCYVKQPSWKRYLPILVCFVLGLMSKPMLVTLPFVLLLVDYWPLKRVEIQGQINDKKSVPDQFPAAKQNFLGLIKEKFPLFILSAIFSYLTILMQVYVKAVVDIQTFPLMYRAGNAFISYATYIRKIIWPYDLTVFYPFEYSMSLWHVSISFIIIIVATVLACTYFHKYSFLFVGWFWYLGALVPVIGLVQVGSQAMADRYVYVPSIGIFIIIAWGLSCLLHKRIPSKTRVLIAVLLIGGLTFMSHQQVKFWKDTLTLFSRTVAMKENNAFAHSNIAGALLEQNKVEEAMSHLQKAITLMPNDYNTLVRKARVYYVRGDHGSAVATLKRAIKTHPDYLRAYDDLYKILIANGKTEEALKEYENAVKANQGVPEFCISYGNVLASNGKFDEAIMQYENVLKENPYHFGSHFNIGLVLIAKGQYEKAEVHFRKTISINPDYAPAHYRLAILLKQKGMIDEAQNHYLKAIRINPALKNSN